MSSRSLQSPTSHVTERCKLRRTAAPATSWPNRCAPANASRNSGTGASSSSSPTWSAACRCWCSCRKARNGRTAPTGPRLTWTTARSWTSGRCAALRGRRLALGSAGGAWWGEPSATSSCRPRWASGWRTICGSETSKSRANLVSWERACLACACQRALLSHLPITRVSLHFWFTANIFGRPCSAGVLLKLQSASQAALKIWIMRLF